MAPPHGMASLAELVVQYQSPTHLGLEISPSGREIPGGLVGSCGGSLSSQMH